MKLWSWLFGFSGYVLMLIYLPWQAVLGISLFALFSETFDRK